MSHLRSNRPTGRDEVLRLAGDAEIDVHVVGPSAHGSWYVPIEEDSDPLSIAPSCL